MDCPVCNVPTVVVERAGIELDYCLDCEGLWFDADELDLLTAALELETDLPDIASLPTAQTDEKPRRCPRCSKKMAKVTMGQVVIDRCPRNHGLWFDAGELGQVVRQHATASGAPDQPVIRLLGEVLSGPQEETE